MEPGRIVDRYEVVGVLGEGGMASVYRVRHTALGSEHALKVLSTEVPAVRERLLAEGRVQAGLDHPHALTVTDVIDVDGAPGLVMELIRGGTLDEWVATDPPRAERLRVFRQIVLAVEAAHANGWIHRDLKPGNVLMKGTGPAAIPKVADFGLVKAVAGARFGSKGTRDGVAMGTPGYMAPEQISDAAAVDARADVYSLGCLLVFLVTGEPAFEGEVLDVFAKVAAGAHRGLPASDPLHPLVERCLARDPDSRPADAGALREALDSAGSTPRRAPVKPARPAPAMPAALLGVGAFLALGFGCLCGAGALWGVLPGSPPDAATVPSVVTEGRVGTCPASESRRRIGYALVPKVHLALDDVHVIPAAVDVIPRPNDRENVACRLPAGTRVLVREVPKSPRSEPDKIWLAVFEDGLTPP
ncbi:MAG: serine/threonine protein kinase [Alphaproteobacteria bacterium]|nr:serine/threonine protein kinase [Alphaproteobacteria bacterium]